MIKPTIYEALVQRLQREPTPDELKAEVARIIHDGNAAGRRAVPKRRSRVVVGKS